MMLRLLCWDTLNVDLEGRLLLRLARLLLLIVDPRLIDSNVGDRNVTEDIHGLIISIRLSGVELLLLLNQQLLLLLIIGGLFTLGLVILALGGRCATFQHLVGRQRHDRLKVTTHWLLLEILLLSGHLVVELLLLRVSLLLQILLSHVDLLLLLVSRVEELGQFLLLWLL